jgi:spore maturation protein CgeB
MRILMVHPGPDFSVHDLAVLTGWHEAFKELGVNCEVFNTHDRIQAFNSFLQLERHPDTSIVRDEQDLPIAKAAFTPLQSAQLALEGLYGALYAYAPDVVFFVSAFFTREETFRLLRARKHTIVILATESPYQDEEQLLRAQWADLNLINDPANIASYEALGIPVDYQPHCYRPSLHHPRTGPRDPALASDFCFIGTAFDSRVAFFEAMDFTGVDALVAGNYWGKLAPESPMAPHVATGVGIDADCVSNDETAEIYRNARTSLNIYRVEGEVEHKDDEAYAMGPREVELSACQLPFLRDPRAEGDEVLHMLPRFSSPGEASDQLRWLLRHEREREKMATQAREAIADRTFLNSAARLLKRLENL